MTDLPIGKSNLPFQSAPDERPQTIRDFIMTPNTCGWCLERFDPERSAPRTTAERGQLRTRLMMADNGTELAVCDNCWSGANGFATFIHGKVVPCADPNEIPNLLLKGLAR